MISLYLIIMNEKKKRRKPKKADLDWLAGLLEGEGSFMAGPPSRPFAPSISLQMTDRDVVARAAKLLGARYWQLSRRNNRKIMYATALRGSPSVPFMKFLLPLMGSRRQTQIRKAIKSFKPYDYQHMTH